MAYASSVDLEEAYAVGRKALELAASGESGYMATILRNPGTTYSVRYDKVPLPDVANSERAFPTGWIAESGCDVTDETRGVCESRWVRVAQGYQAPPGGCEHLAAGVYQT